MTRIHLLLTLTTFIIACQSACQLPSGGIPTYKAYNFTQYLDHFNYQVPKSVSELGTFQQRYLVWDDCWSSSDNPIFFYTGNEGPITDFWDNTGLIFEAAEVFGAMVVFGEHRYYGTSLPFGQNSWTRTNVGYLSSEQALADYSTLLMYLKNHYNAPDAPVIAFGGSYGGMLAAWFRIKYPGTVFGALAASAPIFTVSDVPMLPSYFETVTRDYYLSDFSCPDIVRNAFSQLMSLSNTSAGLQQISTQMNLCQPLKSTDVQHLILWAVNSFGNLAMMDYPYATDFIAPLPGFPIDLSCSLLLRYQSTPLVALAQAAGLFYNGTTGNLKCYDIFDEFNFCADQTGCGTGNAAKSWDYQACTEMIYFPNTNNVTDMFPPRDWTKNNLTAYCENTWGVLPRFDWVEAYYGSTHLRDASRIIFSNGYLDPWHGGGVLQQYSPNIDIVLIEDAAHHLDLRSNNPLDPPSVRQAREKEISIIAEWIFGGSMKNQKDWRRHMNFNVDHNWAKGAYERIERILH